MATLLVLPFKLTYKYLKYDSDHHASPHPTCIILAHHKNPSVDAEISVMYHHTSTHIKLSIIAALPLLKLLLNMNINLPMTGRHPEKNSRSVGYDSWFDYFSFMLLCSRIVHVIAFYSPFCTHCC